MNRALASEIDTLLIQWKDDKPLSHKILDDGIRKKRKRKQKMVPCKSRRFVAAEPSSLNGKWSQAGSSVLYMITWLMPQKPNQRRIQFELFVKEHPTARRIWVEGPIDYELPEPTPESKAQWVEMISKAIIHRSLSQGS
ncbi:MAG: hypothetical protein K2Q26_10510 [Bdellovibrionales bacterium]|nr:hypothetical protein [Bdellovibrionales bacterium]